MHSQILKLNYLKKNVAYVRFINDSICLSRLLCKKNKMRVRSCMTFSVQFDAQKSKQPVEIE